MGRHDDFLENLDTLGFFRYSESASEIRDAIRSDGWYGIFRGESRAFLSDSEDLTEGGVESFLRTIEPFLRRQGVALDSIESSFEPGSYSIRVNGRSYTIWNADDEAREKTQPGWCWGVSSARAIGIVNELLAAAGSEERAYASNGGNDLTVLFLTEPLQRVIADHPDAPLEETPYRLIEEYPWFGQPHAP